MQYQILLVDDEINSLKVLSAGLQGSNYTVDTARSGEEALTLVKNNTYHLIISDYKMPGMNGEKLLAKVKTVAPNIPFILLTAYGTIELAVNAMRKGAYTYLTKPINLNLLESAVKDAISHEKNGGIFNGDDRYKFLNIIGKSPAIQEVFTLIKRVSKTDANILILGESGTGKELIARAIHYTSLRAERTFIPIDCTTIPSELIESELFGYEKGAFTGANESKMGLIEMAQGGTAFLDEIGDLDFSLQKKLLRFLQEKEFRRIGGKEKITADVRILSATNRNIDEAIAENDFRADLYYRLNVITITIPPLRERAEDIPLLVYHYLNTFSKKNKKDVADVEPEVMAAMINYDWPGNVRELENVMERAVILCSYEKINLECLPKKMRPLAEEGDCFEIGEFNLPELEKRIIIKALDNTSWNQSQAAILLGISRKQLRTKMKNNGLLQG